MKNFIVLHRLDDQSEILVNKNSIIALENVDGCTFVSFGMQKSLLGRYWHLGVFVREPYQNVKKMLDENEN